MEIVWVIADKVHMCGIRTYTIHSYRLQPAQSLSAHRIFKLFPLILGPRSFDTN